MSTSQSVSKNLETTHQTISKAARQWNRVKNDINLIAVSKHQTQENIQAALDSGQRLFGENRVQEAYKHWEEIKNNNTYPDLKLHLIGPLQTNKVKEAVALFDVIETLDREKLARKLAGTMKEANKSLPCFIQVNTGEETQKAGITPQDLTDFLDFCQNECALNIIGLMCIPPIDDPAALHFALLRNLAQKHNLPELSMGMSNDYEDAIANGATYIRLGTSIFGQRNS
ncbi:MAG: YggS family pyridoxal phosphate-dependent enzyme [Alphaproteobacteria bacterium]